jgi:hypothetical protein
MINSALLAAIGVVGIGGLYSAHHARAFSSVHACSVGISIARSAAASSRALAGRFSGSFARHEATISSSFGGHQPRTASRNELTLSCMWRWRMFENDSRRNTSSPVSSHHAQQPSA